MNWLTRLCRKRGRIISRYCHDLLNRPYMLTDTGFHRRGNSKRLMYSREVVVHVKQSDHRDVVFDLLAERIRQPGEAAHIHPHVEILSLYIARGNMGMIRVA